MCEEPIAKFEPKVTVAGISCHDYCAPEAGITCENVKCAYQWCVHAGPCVD